MSVSAVPVEPGARLLDTYWEGRGTAWLALSIRCGSDTCATSWRAASPVSLCRAPAVRLTGRLAPSAEIRCS